MARGDTLSVQKKAAQHRAKNHNHARSADSAKVTKTKQPAKTAVVSLLLRQKAALSLALRQPAPAYSLTVRLKIKGVARRSAIERFKPTSIGYAGALVEYFSGIGGATIHCDDKYNGQFMVHREVGPGSRAVTRVAASSLLLENYEEAAAGLDECVKSMDGGETPTFQQVEALMGVVDRFRHMRFVGLKNLELVLATDMVEKAGVVAVPSAAQMMAAKSVRPSYL